MNRSVNTLLSVSLRTCGPSRFLFLLEVLAAAAASHRILQSAVGHVAAHRHVLVVLAGVKRHRSGAALGDGLLAAGALHAVHVNGACSCGGGTGTGEGKMGERVNDSVASSS